MKLSNSMPILIEVVWGRSIVPVKVFSVLVRELVGMDVRAA